MKNLRLSLSALVGAILLFGCGGQSPQPTVDPVASDLMVFRPGGRSVTLQVFGAPWCQSCKEDLPAIDRALQNTLGPNRTYVKLQLWVTTGGKISDPPSPAIAAAYLGLLKLEAEPIADEWMWKRFQMFFPQRPFLLPAAVLVDENGNTPRTYQSGRTSFVAQEIVNRVVQTVFPNSGGK